MRGTVPTRKELPQVVMLEKQSRLQGCNSSCDTRMGDVLGEGIYMYICACARVRVRRLWFSSVNEFSFDQTKIIYFLDKLYAWHYLFVQLFNNASVNL